MTQIQTQKNPKVCFVNDNLKLKGASHGSNTDLSEAMNIDNQHPKKKKPNRKTADKSSEPNDIASKNGDGGVHCPSCKSQWGK